MEEVIHKDEIKSLSFNERKDYLKQILIGLNYSHSKGIIHRDIKIGNILYDKLLHKLRIIDWGLSDFYIPNKEYNVRVSSLQYKAPELLLNQTKYNYSIDVWSFGCIMGSLLFDRIPFFKGKDFNDQLKQIIQFVGYNDFNQYVTKYNITINQSFHNISDTNPLDLNNYVTENNYKYITPESIDLLKKLSTFDSDKRITTNEALHHQFFSEKTKNYFFSTMNYQIDKNN